MSNLAWTMKLSMRMYMDLGTLENMLSSRWVLDKFKLAKIVVKTSLAALWECFLLVGWLVSRSVSCELHWCTRLISSLFDVLLIIINACVFKVSALSSANSNCLIYYRSCLFQSRFLLCRVASSPIFTVDCICPSN